MIIADIKPLNTAQIKRNDLTDIDHLTALIAPEVEALGFDLVRVKWIGAGDDLALQIMAERPETRQLVIEDCAALSRRISEKFDEIDPIEEAYRLEVSSPGIDRPLTRLDDFADWAGHEANIVLIEPIDDRKKLRGTIAAVIGDKISFEDRKFGDFAFSYYNVDSAKLLLTDRLIAATAPLISDGADVLEQDDKEE